MGAEVEGKPLWLGKIPWFAVKLATGNPVWVFIDLRTVDESVQAGRIYPDGVLVGGKCPAVSVAPGYPYQFHLFFPLNPCFQQSDSQVKAAQPQGAPAYGRFPAFVTAAVVTQPDGMKRR